MLINPCFGKSSIELLPMNPFWRWCHPLELMSSPLLISCQGGMIPANCYSLMALMCPWLWDNCFMKFHRRQFFSCLETSIMQFLVLFFFSRSNYMEIICAKSFWKFFFLIFCGLSCQLLQKEGNFAVMTSAIQCIKTIRQRFNEQRISRQPLQQQKNFAEI